MDQFTISLGNSFTCLHRARLVVCAFIALGFALTACGGDGGDGAIPPPPAASVASIITVAGMGTPCPNPAATPACGDGGPAIAAKLNFPTGVAVDAMGNVFIVDASNHRIRRVDFQTGIITTVAGNGTPCPNPAAIPACGDNDRAVDAQLHSPVGIAVDATGNVLIADQNNQRVRRVDTHGTITTVAGTGSAGFNGDNQSAIVAKLNSPTGVAVDAAGNLFIADQSNHRVRRVDTLGQITTVAGTGVPSFNGDSQPAVSAEVNLPTGVAVDVAGNLLIADQSNHRVRRVDTGSKIITTVAGNGTVCAAKPCGDGGPAIDAQLNVPTGVAVDTAGNVIIADQRNYRVRAVSGQSGIIVTVAGNGTACDPTVTPACGDGGLPTAAQLNLPNGVALDRGGRLLIADLLNYRVRLVAP